MPERNSNNLGTQRRPTSPNRGRDKAALVTPCIYHLPLHPACLLGYGAAVLAARYDVDVIDLNADLHLKNRARLKPIFDIMDESRILSDASQLYPYYDEVDCHIERHYGTIPWEQYPVVYITPPSWFPTVPTEAVLRLARTVKQVAPETGIFFYGNSLGSWTNEAELKAHGVQTAHVNDLFAMDSTAQPVRYDDLPAPVYEHRDKYLVDLIPFMLKHGCPWGRCKFCSFCTGSNSGYVERSVKAVIAELESLIDRYDPAALVCRDHSLNGNNLVEFCGCFERFNKPWYGQSRADLSDKKIYALRKSGCRKVFFGLESGSDSTLRAVNKGITTRQMSDFIKEMHSNEILLAPSLMVGAPGEESEDFKKTIQFLADHGRYFDVVNVYPFMATPASDFSHQRKEPDSSTALRLFQVMRTCEDLGLKVCLGEQSIEYYLFKRIGSCDQDVP